MNDLERDITYEVTYRVTTYHRATITLCSEYDIAHDSTADALRSAARDRDDPAFDRVVMLDSFKEVKE